MVSFGYLPVLTNFAGSSSISTSSADLAKPWEDLLEKIDQLLIKRNVKLPEFLKHASSLFSNEISKNTNDFAAYFKKAQRLGEISIWHYSPLEMTLESIFKYDKDYRLLLSKYEGNLMKSLEAINISEIIAQKSIRELIFGKISSESHDLHESSSSKVLIVQMETSIKDKNLQYLKHLWRSLRNQFSLHPTTAIPQDIAGESQIAWKVPKNVSETISQKGRSVTEYFTSNKQIAMWMNEECIYHKSVYNSEDLASDLRYIINLGVVNNCVRNKLAKSLSQFSPKTYRTNTHAQMYTQTALGILLSLSCV